VARYLLDTDVLIDYSREREPVRSRIDALLAEGEDIGICAVQLAEFYAGRRRGDRPDWDTFIDALPCWGITPETAIQAGHYRFSFARRGRTIHTPDALNAAVAWRMRATVVTRNARDYPVPGVPILAL
jgi:predicted nucleic acid-binding protein